MTTAVRLQEHTSQDEMSLQQAQDSGLAPLASGEYGVRRNDVGAAKKPADGVAQMVGRPAGGCQGGVAHAALSCT